MNEDSKDLWLSIKSGLKEVELRFGKATSQGFISDPKRMAFVASRYKFCAKMLNGLGTVLEVGCCDCFGAPIVADAVERLICTDIDEQELALNPARLAPYKNISCQYYDFRKKPFTEKVDGIYLVDVIEHIYQKEEANFMSNLTNSLNNHGVALIGTPNVTSVQYASEHSQVGHVNVKSHNELKDLCAKHFNNVFMFGMNDEVLHTGFAPMAHYLWALCAGPKLT